MPELPEVEVVRRGIERHLVGARIDNVEILDARALTRHRGSTESFIERLRRSTADAVVRRGKFLWLPIGDGDALVVHLGMSGQVRVADGERLRHERVRFALADRSDVAFVDQRLFGSLAIDRLIDTADGLPGGLGSASATIPASVAHIARDVLDPDLDDVALIERLGRRSIAIKSALLNQELVSGIGNIYADEALWAARVHHLTPANVLSTSTLRRVLAEARSVMTTALDAGGTSFDELYVNVNGESGYFDLSLNAYGQTGKPCARCGTPIVRVPWQNRSSHLCPHCQTRR